MKPCVRTFSLSRMHRPPLQNRVLAFVLRKETNTAPKPRGMRLRLMGADGGGERESQPLPCIPQVPKEKEQNTRLPPVRPVRCTPEKRQSPRPRGRGGGRGCLLGLSGAETQRAGARRSPGRRGCRCARSLLALSRPPRARCSPYLAPRPAFVRRAAAGRDGRGRAGGGEAGRGARGARGGGAASRLLRLGAAIRRWQDGGATGAAPSVPAGREGSPPRAVPRRAELPPRWLPTAGSHSSPATKSFAAPKAT